MEFLARPHLEELRGGTAHTLWFSIHYSEAKAEICSLALEAHQS